jgi:ABC-type cobalamin transport system permease subunit
MAFQRRGEVCRCHGFKLPGGRVIATIVAVVAKGRGEVEIGDICCTSGVDSPVFLWKPLTTSQGVCVIRRVLGGS